MEVFISGLRHGVKNLFSILSHLFNGFWLNVHIVHNVRRCLIKAKFKLQFIDSFFIRFACNEIDSLVSIVFF